MPHASPDPASRPDECPTVSGQPTWPGDALRADAAAGGADWAHQWQQHWPRLYPALRRLAARLMAQERPDHTLSPTGLVHEAWLKLDGAEWPVQDRAHFMALAARAMRQVLVNHAQARLADKRRGLAPHDTVSAAEAQASPWTDPAELLALDQALNQLAREDARAAEVAELKVFGGLEVPEMAQALGVSEPTVKRDWVYAKARLAQLLVP